MSYREGDGDLPMRALHYFVMVCHEASFAKAAGRFGVTSSAVSYQIRTLEEWIGASLFDRSTRSPNLTPLGQVLFEGTHAAFEKIDRVATGVRRVSGPELVMISAPPAIATQRLIGIIEQIKSEQSDLLTHVHFVKFDAPVDGDTADVAIRFLYDPPPVGIPLGMPGWSAVLTPSLFESLGKPSHVSELSDVTLFHEAVYNFWPSCFARANCEVPGGLRYVCIADAIGVLSATLAGAGVALLPSEITRHLWRKGALVSINGGNVNPKEGYYAIPKEISLLKPNTERLLAELGKHFN